MHLTQRLLVPLQSVPVNIPRMGFSEPLLAMPDEYKVEGDAQASYRNYYRGAKSHLFVWKNRDIPCWL